MLLNELPLSLRSEVVKQTYRQILETIKFFDDKDPEFLWAILPTFKPMRVYSKDILYNEKDHADEIFFILKGRVKISFDISAEEGFGIYGNSSVGGNANSRTGINALKDNTDLT